ncbi:sterol desaturase family protein [Azospirillum soli]|uniref:sterol desaturase family protein n=1 Tax=Azospirillum soli TaxID=1304799 RepID=UPI001AE2B731|nr:sterol desaturase family protein [Azospirillum soli]MBP2313875.1 sterol desaturase/sphingolipid hydroxylase (fatty acid hydroxylase superfamily) [Azospirillum soli]
MSEAALRLTIFAGIFVAVGLLEFAFPKRPLRVSRWRRWGINLGLVVLDVVILRVTIGALAFATAMYAQARGWGLFNLVDLPFWAEAVAAFLILDFAVYLQHVASHAVPVLWRLHRVHHADLDIDLTSGLRFHPIEILLSMLFKAAVVVAIGADPWVVLLFEAVLNGSAVFTHGNVRLPEWLDAALRWMVCTPDMHRVHHSIDRTETDTNYGFFLSVWDRLCGTYHRAPPKRGHQGAVLGLADHQEQGKLGLLSLLAMPFSDAPRGRGADKGGSRGKAVGG